MYSIVALKSIIYELFVQNNQIEQKFSELVYKANYDIQCIFPVERYYLLIFTHWFTRAI